MPKIIQFVLLSQLLFLTAPIQASMSQKYSARVGEVESRCFKQETAKPSVEESKDTRMRKCTIRDLYPLVEAGNFFAAKRIADTYKELGYPEEQKKWLEYARQMENAPGYLVKLIDLELEKLNQ